MCFQDHHDLIIKYAELLEYYWEHFDSHPKSKSISKEKPTAATTTDSKSIAETNTSKVVDGSSSEAVNVKKQNEGNKMGRNSGKFRLGDSIPRFYEPDWDSHIECIETIYHDESITSHWCQSCQSQQFRENFDNWTTGFEEIDNFIKETQLNAKDCTEYLEFLPFKSFIGINKYDTSETVTGHLMMVAETCEWDLRHYVSHHFARLTWSHKVAILHSIACALESYQRGEQVHRDHASNVQIFKSHLEIPVNELGLGDNKDPIPIVGYYKNDILPYMAPEILQNKSYSIKSDVYSFGMLMWELSTNKPPFYDKTRNSKLIDDISIHNLRPKNDSNTPKCYVDLMERCWSSDPNNRPEISEIVKILSDWHLYCKHSDEFKEAEKIRLSNMKAKGLDTTPGKMVSPPKIHPQAIYTSRKIKFPILPLSGVNSQRIKQSYDASNKNSIDLASLLVRDESYFVKTNRPLQTKELEEEEVDDDLRKQYELSIPFDSKC
ncbi:6778_t:CDS:2 [Racocetra fulgida]|uniref:6778_t:CDS:1 n=1 Tax=Racocetra fulgida TaxID=60492 RepID=A0A9N8Z7M7_9GLOM|nr:6778_t:CDS:2 [Racocetra fulgida]